MPCKSAIALALVAAASIASAARQTVDWSGDWISRDQRDVVIIRNVHGTAHGWDSFVERLRQTRAYSITVAQTPGEVTVTFPGGASNMLTAPGFAFGAEPRSTVSNRGDWWTKAVTSARWSDGSLELSAMMFSGWW